MISLQKRLKESVLYCFTPDKFAQERDIIEIVKQQIAGGCDIIQLREKKMPARDKMQLALQIRKLTQEKNVLFIVNDDVDIAYLSKADGVHLGQDDLPLEYARELLKDKLIGLSTHNLIQYKEAQLKDADYTAIGPIFPTITKDQPDPVLGIDSLKEILLYKKKPTVVIGGINSKNLDQFKGLDVDMFAIVRDILYADSIEEKIKEIKNKISHGSYGHTAF